LIRKPSAASDFFSDTRILLKIREFDNLSTRIPVWESSNPGCDQNDHAAQQISKCYYLESEFKIDVAPKAGVIKMYFK